MKARRNKMLFVVGILVVSVFALSVGIIANTSGPELAVTTEKEKKVEATNVKTKNVSVRNGVVSADNNNANHEDTSTHTTQSIKPNQVVSNTSMNKITLADLTMNSQGSCKKGAPVRYFNIVALQLNVVYNNYGDHDPKAKIYALSEDVVKIKNAVKANPDKPTEEIKPLAIRANKGDCVEVSLTNTLSEKASIHIEGVDYNIRESDGMAVGFNPDSTVSPNSEIKYRWNASEEGTFFFYNGADLTYNTDPLGQKGTMGDGLFGALIVEPEGAKWTDPVTGEELSSGLYADISLPNQPDFREYTVFFQDGVNVVPGSPQPDEPKNEDEGETEVPEQEPVEEPEVPEEEPHEPGEVEGPEKELYAVNYRAEPLEDRVKNATTEDGKDPTNFYSSWVYGDPPTPITRAYLGDPIKFRVIGANPDENHVFHLHGHRWKSDSKKTNTIDSETLNIGDTETAELINNAGYVSNGKGAPGDYLWHCHLFPHYFEGMWGLFRVYDKAQPDLKPLQDRDAPPSPTAEAPGFPEVVPGEIGKRAPKPPDPELRPPTEQEKATLDALLPGAPNVNRCAPDAPMRTYHVVGIEKDITYNTAGDHDKDGRMYVLAEDEEKVKNGEIRPRPLVLRANQGDCVEVTLENKMYEAKEPNSLSMHIHYVAYDPLGSDGTAVGWNYNQRTEPGEKIRYRWYADEEGNIFFHDHMSAGEKGFHGTFGTLIVEPKGSKWLDPKTGKEIKSGTEAMIVHPEKEDFREQVLLYHDFARLWDKDGKMLPLESDPENVSHAHGYAAVNYSNAPFFRRNNADPAYVFSSWVHGDPQTPIIQTYPGDPIKIRLIQGAHETQHNFNLHGLSWKREADVENSELTSTQTIGMSEQFTMDIQPNPVGVRQRDYLWSSQPIEDLWSGLWGFVRVWGENNDNLKKLPDRPDLKTKVDRIQLLKMKKNGQKLVKAKGPGNACPPAAPVKKFNVTAFMKDIKYNKYGDHDPFGIMFALTNEVNAIKAGTKPTEPLVLRANEGDCIQVTLSNSLPLDPPENKDDPALLMADQVTWKNSNRVSLHPQMLQYDIQGSDGATVGYNFDQTIAPGETITYRWYADQEYGGTILYDYGDIRSHRLHGAYGSLIIEPKGSQYRDPKTGKSIISGARADIIVPDKADFREQVLMFSDGLYTIGRDGSRPTPEHVNPQTGLLQSDLEDRGEKGINYSSEPFKHRLLANPDKSLVFSSVIHGDPSTPIPEAYLGDPIRMRVMQTADRTRGSVFTLNSHRWRYQWTDPNSKLVSSQGSLTPGETLDIIPVQNADFLSPAGDYLYREMKLRRYLEGGLWGILRYHDQPKSQLLSLPDRSPVPPTNNRVVYDPRKKLLTFTWNASTSENIVGYNIYRKVAVGKVPVKMNPNLIPTTTYIEVASTKPGNYYYSISVVDKFGNESQLSREVYAIIKR